MHSPSQDTTPLRANIFSTGIHRLLVINIQRSDFTLRKHYQGQNRTPVKPILPTSRVAHHYSFHHVCMPLEHSKMSQWGGQCVMFIQFLTQKRTTRLVYYETSQKTPHHKVWQTMKWVIILTKAVQMENEHSVAVPYKTSQGLLP